jgi:hypothetical protein
MDCQIYFLNCLHFCGSFPGFYRCFCVFFWHIFHGFEHLKDLVSKRALLLSKFLEPIFRKLYFTASFYPLMTLFTFAGSAPRRARSTTAWATTP